MAVRMVINVWMIVLQMVFLSLIIHSVLRFNIPFHTPIPQRRARYESTWGSLKDLLILRITRLHR